MGEFTNNYIIQDFITEIYMKLISGIEIPKLKLIFNHDAFELFNLYKDKTFITTTGYINITDGMINNIKNNNYAKEDEYSINVSNAALFFDKLTEIANLYTNLSIKYNTDRIAARTMSLLFLESGLWLRLTPYDFSDIYGFLDRQITYLKNTCVFDDIRFYLGGEINELRIGSYMGYSIYTTKDMNSIWYETNLNMSYSLYDKVNKTSYDLPMIHYEIDHKTCYIYAIQKPKYSHHDKKIERSLYKLNKGVLNPNIHPSFVLSMNLFIDMLSEKDINNIKVPLLEVLNYDYHVILSDREKEIKDLLKNLEDYINDEDEMNSKDWASRIIDREDSISKNKVENLANIMYRIENQYGNIDISVDDYMLDVKVKNRVKELKR